MAGFKVYNGGDVEAMFGDLAKIPEDVKTEILTAMAKTAKDAQADSARSMGIVDTGQMIASLKVKKPSVTQDGGSCQISFEGTRTDEHHKKPTRNAEIAFINEFGTGTTDGRGFIKSALEKNAKKISEAGEKVFREWQDKKIN